MKVRHAAAVAGVVAARAYAQSNVTAAASISYTTVTYESCESAPMATIITVTNGVTVTYCPECEMMSNAGYTTVYTTTYMSLCPTGMVPETYTVTESCTEATPTWTPGPSHIPQGFTVTTKECMVCESTPTTVTVTEPCGCEAHEGVPATNMNAGTTPGSGSSGNTPAATTPAGSSPSGGSSSSEGSSSPSSGSLPSSNGGAAPAPAPAASGNNGGSAPYPTATATTETCPGPQCRIVASSYPSSLTSGNTSGIESFTGAASSLSSVGLLSSFFMAVIIAALAFTL